MTPEQRDFRRLRTLGEALIRQADFYAANTWDGKDDSLRALHISACTDEVGAIGQRMRRRFLRAKGGV